MTEKEKVTECKLRFVKTNSGTIVQMKNSNTAGHEASQNLL